ncbi:MAG: BatA domain-containing protein [Planctomycetales bacterium]
MPLLAPPILAFGFLSPGFLLWGLVLAGVPILIHLLHRRNYRETNWAAMRFLLNAVRKNARRVRLEQLLLLAVRVLILLLVAFALAQPYLEGVGQQFASDSPTHRVIVVDASFSMGHVADGGAAFDRARDLARRIAQSVRPGDALNLVRIAGSSPAAIVREPAYRTAQVIEEIDRLSLTDEPGDLAAALAAVEEALAKARDIGRKEVVLIGDVQRSMWRPQNDAARAALRAALDRIARTAKLTLAPIGAAGAPNAAIVDFEADEPFAATGRPISLGVTVRNFGSAVAASRKLELYADGRLLDSREVQVEPESERREDFTHTFLLGGEHRLEARLTEDALPADDRRWLALPVKEEIHVLLVSGKRTGRSLEDATSHVRLALAPPVKGESARGLVRPHVIPEGDLPATALGRYDCVFLCNVAMLTPREADLLRAYVEVGGGLVVCVGDQVRQQNYNEVLFETGLLPARLGDAVSAPEESGGFQFDAGDYDHPIVRAFEGNPDAGLETSRTDRYLRTTVPERGPARVALRFTDGGAAIIDQSVGRGRSILIATSIDRAWGTWPVWPSFPPLMHEIVLHAVSDRWQSRQLVVGQPIDRIFALRAYDMPASIVRPDESSEPIALAEEASFVRAAYAGTDRRGLYELRLGPPLGKSEWFAVNVDPAECDLATLSERDLRQELFSGIPFDYSADVQPVAPETVRATVARSGLTHWLLAAAFALMFVELLMAWRFPLGLLLLTALTAAGIAWGAAAWHPAIGWIAGLFLAGGVAILARRILGGTRPTSSPLSRESPY